MIPSRFSLACRTATLACGLLLAAAASGQQPTPGEELRRFADFTQRFQSYYAEIIKAIDASIEIDIIGGSLIAGQIPEEEAEAAFAVQARKAQAALAEVRRLRAADYLKPPVLVHPALSMIAGRTKDIATSLLATAEKFVDESTAIYQSARRGDKLDTGVLVARRFDSYVGLLEGENAALALTAAAATADHPQLHLSECIVHSNTALMEILRAQKVLTIDTTNDAGASPMIDKAFTAIGRSRRSTGDGRLAVTAMFASTERALKGNPQLLGAVHKMLVTYETSFDVESEVQSVLENLALNTRTRTLMTDTDPATMLSPLVDKRMAVFAERVRLVAELGALMR